MAMLVIMRRGNYTNEDAVENVIRYVTRTRKNETRKDELIAWGGYGIGWYGGDPELAIEQFKYVQDVYGINSRGGKRIFHEVLGIKDTEFALMWNDYGIVYQIAMDCAQKYYAMGHQVVFAIHHTLKDIPEANKGLHIHFVVNAVNFRQGNKWHTSIRQSDSRQEEFKQNMRSEITKRVEEPLEFLDPLQEPLFYPVL